MSHQDWVLDGDRWRPGVCSVNGRDTKISNTKCPPLTWSDLQKVGTVNIFETSLL